ncbi:hypothetical protein Scep_020919 [Stephania cephalantha]|uniref:Uncharacterized protein n=1 Tax=Stephania cephalantha TaxID=152367 RepID=A0AAP0F548_9MAGN
MCTRLTIQMGLQQKNQLLVLSILLVVLLLFNNINATPVNLRKPAGKKLRPLLTDDSPPPPPPGRQYSPPNRAPYRSPPPPLKGRPSPNP